MTEFKPTPRIYSKELMDERSRQLEKWGYQHHPDGTKDDESHKWQADWDRDVTDEAAKFGGLTWRHILQEEISEAFAEEDWDKLRVELIQVAAVCLSWLEDGDTRVTMD